ncbi:Por secretion system C-terminal sorting domain-containing protein [Apibacter mensalis]|uniref:Por secretion system C-terminal sorting domain-containing protein n=1 Tax=Apibacter mensalis TaxID=1586267 RepID=A0A0X3AQ63_9FLAO|nr:T9SS type A sorting domain-containing protein [Apibacter mensalis]CVK16504.1 Por secretion system C-terminal sorting domain-containing protein [Apibacter mensalis]
MRKLYLLLLVGVNTIFTSAQESRVLGPGGVSGAVLWMKTVPETKNLNGRYLWKDFSGDSLRLTHYDSNTEYAVEWYPFGRSINFNPSILLTNTSVSKEIQIKSGNLSTATILGTYAEASLLGNKFEYPDYIFTLNGVEGKGLVLNKDKIIHSNESNQGVLDYGSKEGNDLMYHPKENTHAELSAYQEKTMRLFTYFRANKRSTDVWGERRSSHLSIGEKFYSFNQYNNSTYNTNLFDPNTIYRAYMPELILFDRLLNPLEKIKAESYLALKYGFMLDNSLIGSNGQLLWDKDQNEKYNHRVTGIYRDDASGLYQRKSSTSYEESPYYSYSLEGDSYDDANNYNLSNRNKLLVIEKFPADSLEDTYYMIWGDNNKDLKTAQIESLAGMNIMNRRWLINTRNNKYKTKIQDVSWKVSDNLVAVKEKYKYSRIKMVNDRSKDSETAIMYTELPLPGYEGHASLTLGNPYGGIMLKFGTQEVTNQQKPSANYGVFIDHQGKIFTVIKGIVTHQINHKVHVGDRIQIDKTKDNFIIRFNGYAPPIPGFDSPNIPLDEEDINKPFHVSLVMYRWNLESEVQDLRIGGLINSGNRVELGYIKHRAEEFSEYKDGRAYLLIDRSGTGDFKLENTDFYLSDEYDPYRQKVIFNNVFFDTDFSGKDVFTFGYRPDNIIAKINKTDPGCDASSTTEKDGSIQIKILRGDEGFEYELIDQKDQEIKKSGVFFGKDLYLNGLSAGEYTLKLKELGGFNILSDSTGVEAKAHSIQSIDWDRGGFFETTLKGTDQDFQMGLSLNPRSNSVSDIVIQSGFEIKQGRIYIIKNQVKSSTPLANVFVKEGDRIQIYKDFNERQSPYKVYYKINGKTFYTESITHYHYFAVKLNHNAGGIYNIRNTDGFNESLPTYWNYQGVHPYPKTENLSKTTLEQTVILKNNCAKDKEIENTDQLVKSNNPVQFYYKDFNNKSEISGSIKLKHPSSIMITVFDFSGNMVFNKQINKNDTDHNFDITGLSPGVYIVKIFSDEGEFTKKISIN